jgi:hypothetical protein
MKMYLARDKGDQNGEDDYWLASDPMDKSGEIAGEYGVMWMPYSSETCTTIPAKMWEDLGGLKIEPGEGQIDVEVELTVRRTS